MGKQPSPYRRFFRAPPPPRRQLPPAPLRWDSLRPRAGCGKSQWPSPPDVPRVCPGGRQGHARLPPRQCQVGLAWRETAPLVEPDLRILWLEEESYKARHAAPQQATRAPALAASTTSNGGGAGGAPAPNRPRRCKAPPSPSLSQLLANLRPPGLEEDWYTSPGKNFSLRPRFSATVFVPGRPLPGHCHQCHPLTMGQLETGSKQ